MNSVIKIAVLLISFCALFACRSVSYTKEVQSLTYASVKYIAATDSPYVEIRDENNNVYIDYGDKVSNDEKARKGPQQLFEDFYIKAYNTKGIIVYTKQSRGSDNIVSKACYSCESLD
jgi:hypothetical protein